jgi:hypothetical protein
MNVTALDRGELVAILGGILLGLSLFLSWYSLGNRNAVLEGCRGPDSISTGWWPALVADLLILTGAVWRSKESGARRKPLGVL